MEVPNSKAKLLLAFFFFFFSFKGQFLCLFYALLVNSSQVVASGSVVKSLPGFEGPLPFELETGYVGVGESEDVELFYYFVKSESNPKEDPLVLWLTGGPGCSSFSAFAYEIGPLNFEQNQKDGSFPTLVLNPYSWSKAASIIFVDLPVGTGFSYARSSTAAECSDLQACDQAYQFLRKWLIDHPEFLLNPVYVGGDSYSGITVPVVVQVITNGNEEGIVPFINLNGYILGNAETDPDFESNYRIPFAHGMGLISDELYKSLQRNCQGQYFNVDPSNTKCKQDVQAYQECISGLNTAQILEPACGFASPKPRTLFSKRRFVQEEYIKFVDPDSPLCASSRIDGYRLSHVWLNDNGVREALHIKKGSIGEWIRCNYGLPYKITIRESFQYHVKLSSKGYRSLVYSGDHDMLFTYLGTQAWIRSLNYSIVDDWRSWAAEGQIAGYTRTYSNGMTFATIKGGGHTAPEYKPLECSSMFRRWISRQPL
ncbi:serine carboxypeptidase-like 13 isoform X2 [Diospyros lotus]|uniref:serine carboxypeptidase-like 13 isoform X2 n=1 Tax=Diospyros lotus TaxID=55363 RepID=UPI00224CD532|nr:serine carboxypeptidase-like 13 isoform X2 [Diospyros lotus]